MLREIVESLNERLGPKDFDFIKKVILKRMKDCYNDKKDCNKSGIHTPFTYVMDCNGKKIFLSREGMPSGWKWRLGVGGMGGTHSGHNINSIIDNHDADKFNALMDEIEKNCKKLTQDNIIDIIAKYAK